MNANHTPGPWTAIEWTCHANTTVVTGEAEHRVVIADCFSTSGYKDDEAEANARLIAAAPEMADLILRTYTHVSHGGPTREEAERVLRRAGILL